MKTLNTLIFLFILTNLFAQTVVTGKVTDKKGRPLIGVNIFFKDTYDGTTTDTSGIFIAETHKHDSIILIAKFIGFNTFEKEIIQQESQLNIILKENTQNIDGVTVTAGTFIAGDKNKASIMNSMDIYTMPGTAGSITSALMTLPGTQQSNDDGRLLVRGGEASETKTVIDGLLAGQPYYSKVPDSPSRSRFSPSLFEGFIFNTGGYSAEYGQALSSILIMESKGIETKDICSLSLYSIGSELNYTNAWKNNSLSLSGQYIDMSPYYNWINNQYDWETPSRTSKGSIIYRHQTQKGGLLKAYLTGDKGISRFNRESGIENLNYLTQSKSNQIYGNMTYTNPLKDNLILKTGISTTWNKSDILYGYQTINNKELNMEVKAMLIHNLNDKVKLKYGISNTLTDYHQKYQENIASEIYNLQYNENLLAGFSEAQIQFSKNIALSSGIRYEYSTLLNQSSLAPRLGLAISTGKHSMISMSYGHFYQTPISSALKFSTALKFEKATHYILGFQSGQTDNRFFRVESYFKNYDHLLKYNLNENYYSPAYYTNSGKGYAYGLDIFWKDKKSIKHMDYSISYSFIDSKREFKKFSNEIQPDFISNHTLSITGKYWISAINCQIGASYWLASPRNWYEEQKSEIISHKAQTTNQLNMNLSYITNLFNHSTIIYASLSNVSGNNNIYTFQEGPFRNSDNQKIYLPVTDDVKQNVFLGIIISL